MSNLIKSAVESSIGSKPYSADAAGSWSAAILEKCVARLVALDKPFKVQGASGMCGNFPLVFFCRPTWRNGSFCHLKWDDHLSECFTITDF